MSIPPNPGPQDPYGQPSQPGGATPYGSQPGYPQQPPSYPQTGLNSYGPQGYPQQPQGYGQMPPPPPGSFGANPAVRPGMVTAAAVLGFVVGGLTLIAALLIFGLSSSSLVTGLGFLKFLAVIQVIIAAAMIWGGVQAINGKDARILTAAGAVAILLQIISMIIRFQASSVLGFVIPILIVYFLVNPQSKAWFDRKGAKHF